MKSFEFSRSLRLAVTAAVATAILCAGIAYSIVRPVTYESFAKLVLVPTPDKPEDLSSVLDSFQRSGTAGTYVELLASGDTLKRAGNPPVAVDVRSIPDTRVISISASSEDKNIVQPALRSLLQAAQRDQGRLVDVWELRVLQAPGAPTTGGTSTSLIIVATLLLTLLGGVAAWTLLYRFGAPPTRRPPPTRSSEGLPPADWLTREAPRYPTSR